MQVNRQQVGPGVALDHMDKATGPKGSLGGRGPMILVEFYLKVCEVR